MKLYRYHITYRRVGSVGSTTEAQFDAHTMVEALTTHADYWAQRGIEVEHISCLQGCEM